MTRPRQRAWIEAVQGFGRSCLERSGGLLEHISTVETVRDLDLLRGLVGDGKINYFGSSYGTRIGALYAELYPAPGRPDGARRVGQHQRSDTITQTEGFERALDHFAALVRRRSAAGSGEQQGGGARAVQAFLDELDQRPLPVGSRTLTQQLGVEAVSYSMYGGLAQLATAARRPGRGDLRRRRADAADAGRPVQLPAGRRQL